jgi:hypothetical protein
MTSLGMPSGPGALPVPSEFIVLSNVSRFIIVDVLVFGSLGLTEFSLEVRLDIINSGLKCL